MCMRPPRRVSSSSWYSSWKIPDAGGHPLHVAGADHAGVARVVAVRDRALPGQRHGLEAAVRVPADAALAAREGRELLRRTVVHQHEGAHALGGQLRARESRSRRRSRCRPSETPCCGECLRRCERAERADVDGGRRLIEVVVVHAAQGSRRRAGENCGRA